MTSRTSKWRVLACVVFGVFMVVLDATVVNVALRTLGLEFHAAVNDAQWVISVYTLAVGIGTPLAATLGDRFGQKRVFLAGLALFTLGSLACGLAPTLWSLVVARGVQGLGGGIALPLGTAMLFTAFPREEQGKALGLFGLAVIVAPALGPIVGGYLVDAGHWRWIFFLNVPIGALGLTLGTRWLVEHRAEQPPPMDWPGIVTSTLGFGCVLYAASMAAEDGFTSPRVLTGFAVGGAALIAFTVIELRVATAPLLELRLFTNHVFRAALLVGWVTVIALFGAEFMLPLYLMVLRGKTALEVGVILLPLAGAGALVTPIAGRLYDRIGPRALVVAGFALLAINTWQFAHLAPDTPMREVMWLLALRGAGLGLTAQTTFVAGLSRVPAELYARASGLVNASRQVVQSIGVAVLATIVSSAISPVLRAAAAAAAAEGGSPQACLAAEAAPRDLHALGVATFCHQFATGLADAYMFTFYGTLLALVLAAFLPGWPGRWQPGRPVAGLAGH